MKICLYLGLWDVSIEAQQQELIDAIRELFGDRSGPRPRLGTQVMACEIIDEPEQFKRLNESIPFDGPCLKISPQVTAEYSLGELYTYIRVQYTAIIELSAADPLAARVFLEPLALSGNSIRPLPEAFLYPLVVEWMRNVGTYLVHCGAVTINGKAIILIGQPGSGKTTHVLRMLQKGAGFLADDILLLHARKDELLLLPFREVANLSVGAVETFPELSFLTDAPRRGDGKFQVSIGKFFSRSAVAVASPGIVLHLYPEQEPWLRPRSTEMNLDGIHNMNWFVSRKEESVANFFQLTDLMMASDHFDVSQGFLAKHLDDLMAKLHRHLK